MLASAMPLTGLAGFAVSAQAQEMRVTLAAGSVTRATVRPGSTLTVNTNRSFSDLVVGSADIADVVPLSDRSLYIQGKAPGFTNISVFDENRNLLGVIDVRVQQNYDDLEATINAAVANAAVNVSNVNNTIRLSGSVRNATDLSRVLEIARQFAGDRPVINALNVGDAQQVSLEVRVIEASRTAGRDLGVNWVVRGGAAGPTAIGPRVSVNVDQDTKLLTPELQSSTTPFGTLVAQVLSTSGISVDVIIDALESKGLARRLAQPNLTAVSGEVARFHAGGEVPIETAVSNGGGVGTSIDYRPYGVRLEFVPTVLGSGQVNLRVLTEVSELDRSLVVNGNPGFTSRKAETVVELRDGQSFAMAGLLQTVNARDVEQIPWLGQVPVLGALFRSSSFQKRESDLVIVITPRIVRPAAPGEKLYSPLDQTRSSNDFELFALGLLEVDKDMIRKFRDGDGIIGPYGHRIDLTFGDGYVAKK